MLGDFNTSKSKYFIKKEDLNNNTLEFVSIVSLYICL